MKEEADLEADVKKRLSDSIVSWLSLKYQEAKESEMKLALQRISNFSEELSNDLWNQNKKNSLDSCIRDFRNAYRDLKDINLYDDPIDVMKIILSEIGVEE